MYQAAICEDDNRTLNYIENELANSFLRQNISVAFDLFTNGKRLLHMIENHYHYDIIFMDIEMPDENGIDLCRKIRLTNPDVLIVFISSKEQFVFQSLEVQPFRFVPKNRFIESIPSVTQALVLELFRRIPNIIQIIEPRSKDVFSFDTNQILYIEAQGKSCKIVTKTDEFLAPCNFKYFEEKLTSLKFIKPHRSYLVNSMYIFHIQKQKIELNNHMFIPISRNRVDLTKKQFLHFISEEIL